MNRNGRPIITECRAREILDSRGNPTLETEVYLSSGASGRASVPSGASTGIYEAHELRDGDAGRFGGRGVRDAVARVNDEISPRLAGMCADRQADIDREMIHLDGTPDRSRLGANATLSVSLAAARAASEHYGLPLWRYVGGAAATHLPVPMFNILNGGAHAGNNIEIQEFMVVPVGATSFAEALRCGAEIYHALGRLIRGHGLSTAVGDEGGYAPDLDSDEEALDLIVSAIGEAGYTTDRVRIALDAAAGEWYREGGQGGQGGQGVYHCPKRGGRYTPDELCDMWESYAKRYPICSIEDGLDQRDFGPWRRLTERLGRQLMLVGDDLFVTNPERLAGGIADGAANAVLMKPNQIGTLSQTFDVAAMARSSGYVRVMSHRSGETGDTSIADLAVALGCEYIKSGAPCRSERVEKYNRLLYIEEELGDAASYGSARVARRPEGAVEI